jgi:hypothetical protein
MRFLYAVRRLFAQPMTDEIGIAIAGFAALVVFAVDALWGLPQ